MSTRAKLFWNGRSQVVRLPKEFRFSGDELLILRANDKVILEPVHKGWELKRVPRPRCENWVS